MCIIKVCINKRYTLNKKEKLLKAMRNNPKDDCQDEVVPYKKPVKAYYVIRALRSIGEYDEKK